jgi:hypothetical protein
MRVGFPTARCQHCFVNTPACDARSSSLVVSLITIRGRLACTDDYLPRLDFLLSAARSAAFESPPLWLCLPLTLVNYPISAQCANWQTLPFHLILLESKACSFQE